MGRLMVMNKRTRTAILLQTFIIVGLVSGLWILDSEDSVLLSMPNIQDAAQMEKRLHLSDNHDVLLIPAAAWQRELVQRSTARGALADRVIAGQLNLLEAAAGFRDLDVSSPSFDLENFRQHISGNSDEEKYCRLVITVVEGQLKAPYDAFAAEVVTKLERELDRHIRASTLQFPPTSSEKPTSPGEIAPTEHWPGTRTPPRPHIPTNPSVH